MHLLSAGIIPKLYLALTASPTNYIWMCVNMAMFAIIIDGMNRRKERLSQGIVYVHGVILIAVAIDEPWKNICCNNAFDLIYFV